MGLKRTEPFPHTPPAPRKEVKTGKKETEMHRQRPREEKTQARKSRRKQTAGVGVSPRTLGPPAEP